MTDLSGRCLCGQVSWTSTGPILWAGHCHCDSCRRATGAPFVSFFGVPRQTVEVSGALTVRASSDDSVDRAFCPACGAHITYQNTIWPEETHLYAATLDSPGLFVPQAHYHYAERLPWIDAQDGLPRHSGSADVEVTP